MCQNVTGKLLIKMLLILKIIYVKCTIDMNLSEFQYLADHLHSEECRKLVAALHFDTFETPNALDQSEKKISKDVPCLEQLLHWNSEKGGGKRETHEIVTRRLTQIGRDDLSKWLSTKAYEALGHDFERMTRDAFKLYEPIHLPKVNLTKGNKVIKKRPTYTQVTTTKKAIVAGSRRIIKQEPLAPPPSDPIADPTEWTIFDTISWTIVILLFLIIIVLMVYLTMAAPCCRKKKKRKRRGYVDDDESFSPSTRIYNDRFPCSDNMSECPFSPQKQSNRCSCMHSDFSQTPRVPKTSKPSRGRPCLARPPSSRNQQSDEEDNFYDNQRMHRQVSVQTITEKHHTKIRPTAVYNVAPNPRRNRPRSSKSVHLVGSSVASEANLKSPNRAALELMGVDMPRGHRKNRPHPHVTSAVAQAFRTIDIHQKIAIPMNSNAGT